MVDTLRFVHPTSANTMRELHMTATSLLINRQTCFQFKTSFAPCTIMQIARYDLQALQQELTEIINSAPTFFLGAPLIIDLEKIKSFGEIDFARLKEILAQQKLIPMGVRNGSPEQLEAAANQGLPALSVGKLTHSDNQKKKIEKSSAKL